MKEKVEKYTGYAGKWEKEIEVLRKIILDCGLTEEIKWGKPCFTFNKKNIVLIQGFKEYCALLFFKGYEMDDPENILVKTGKNTVVSRQIRLTSRREIKEKEKILKDYLHNALEIEKIIRKKPVQ